MSSLRDRRTLALLPLALLLSACAQQSSERGEDAASASDRERGEVTAAAKLIEDAYNAGDGKAVLEGFCAEHEKTIRAGEGEESFAKGVTSLAESGKLDPAAKTKIVVKGEVASGAWEASMSAGPGGSTTVTFRDETGEWCLDPNPGTK